MKWIVVAILILLVLIIAVVLTAEYGQNNQGAASPAPATTTIKTSLCLSVNGLPDANCTPGAIDAAVTQSNIQSTICVSGYTSKVRPPVSYTNRLKAQQITDYGYNDTSMSDYEEDHLIPLELGGSPTDPRNLWPEPYNITNGARVKDKLENRLHDMVCNDAMPLAEAQQEIASNWYFYYSKYT